MKKIVNVLIIWLLLASSNILASEKAYFGAQVSVPESHNGVKVVELFDQCSAQIANIKLNDEIFEVNSKAVKNVDEFISSVSNKQIGETIEIKYKRGNSNFKIDVEMKSCTLMDAQKLFKEEYKYKEAVEIFEKYPNSPFALNSLAYAYALGLGVEENFHKACSLAEQSSNLNNARGMRTLAYCYLDGLGGYGKDTLEAIMLYKLAFKEGDRHAAVLIGDLYKNGNDVLKKDVNKASEWYSKALDSGLNSAYISIGDLAFEEQNFQKSLEHYMKYERLNKQEDPEILERIGSVYTKLNNNDIAKSYYKKAYDIYKVRAELNDLDAIGKILSLKNQNVIPENELVIWMKKGVDNKMKAAFYVYYGFLLNNKGSDEEMISLLEKGFYENKWINHGCNLASYYQTNTQLKTISSEKAFEISQKLIDEHPINDEIFSCYTTLAHLYRSGTYLSQDYNKAIETLEKYFKNIEEVYYKVESSINIAEIYLKELEDYDNAQKWYKIVYELTKDNKYLSIVESYKKSKPIYAVDKKTEQDIFPILENFVKKEQVVIYLESEKYYFISTDSKSIRIYDKFSLEYIKELRSWVSDGFLGVFITMAYDEKNELLYTATFNSDKDFSRNDSIKVFDINTGKVVKIINNKKAKKNTFLSISDDGKYLVAINNFNLLNIIDAETNSVQHYNLNGKGQFLKAKIEKNNDDYFIYLVSADYQLYTFSLKQKKRIAKEAYRGQTSFEKAFSNTVNHSNFVEPEQNGPRRAILKKDSEVEIVAITFHIPDFKDPDQVTLSVISEILYSGKSSRLYKRLVNDINKLFYHEPFDIEELSLDNETLQIKAKTNNLNFYFNTLTLDKSESFEAGQSKASKIKIVPKHNARLLEVYDEDDKLLSEIALLYVNALKYQVLDNKYVLVVTSDMANMLIFTLDGKPIVNLRGFKSLQTNISFKKGLLTTFGTDNIINIFNLKNLDMYSKKEKKYNPEVLQGLSNLSGGNPLDDLNESDEEILESTSYFKQALGFEPTANQVRLYSDLVMLEKEEIQPLASLYIKNEKDWILYTPEGLFTYGGEGHKLLKYHQNQGLYKEAKIIENDQLFDKFYRPDLIKKILAGEKVDIPTDIKSIILNIKPPELKIVSHNMINQKDIDLTYQVCDTGNGVASPKLLINGQSINPPSSRGFSVEKIEAKENNCKVYKSIHTLSLGDNTISVKAYDKDKNIASESEAINVRTEYKLEKKSDLYFLSIAVSDYKNDSFDLKYSVNDVEKVKEKIQQKSKSVYENIYTYELHDRDVNLENINKTFDEIKSKISKHDAFILYIAGHGVSEDGLYQFIPYDETKKISINEIKTNLSKLENDKSLVLLDTCQSGAAIDNVIDEKATVNRLSYDDNRNYIVASSKNQVALEGYKNHGVFTYSVLDAFIKNDKLKVWGLADHISEVVPKITQEKFHFIQTPQAKLNKNFILTGDEE